MMQVSHATSAPPYTFVPEPQNRLLIIRIEGFLSPGTAEQFVLDLHEQVAALRAPPGQHVLLFDTRKSTVQPNEILEHARAKMIVTANKSRRIAMVLGSGLMRLQIKRVAIAPYLCLFDDIEEARTWVLDT